MILLLDGEGNPLPGMTRRLRRGSGTCSPMGRSHFSFDGERKVCKRKPAARRLQRRPTSLRTAAKPCATLVLGYALHGLRPFLALVGLRPPLVVGFGLREPFGLSSASARCAHPPGKSPLLPIFERGSSQCRAQTNWLANSCHRARSCSLFSSFKKGGPFSLRCLSPLCSPAVGVGQAYPLQGGWLPDGWLALQGQRPTSLRKDVGLCCEP